MAAKGSYDNRHLDENHPYDGSGMATRTCTDLPCFVIFIGYLIGMCCISTYGFQNGNPRRLTHGFNYKGELCGVDEGVVEKPLIFWCRANGTSDGEPSALDMDFPICVSSCPKTYSEAMTCPGDSSYQVKSKANTQTTIITQKIVKLQSYPTMAFGGQFCVPHKDPKSKYLGDDPLVNKLLGPNGPLGNSYFRVAAAFGSLRRSWKLVLTGAAVSVLLSYVYLGLLKLAPYSTAFVSLSITILVTFLLSLYFLLGEVLRGDWMESYMNSNALYKLFTAAYAAWISKVLGLLLLTMFCFMAVGLSYMKKSITKAVGCVSATTECIFSMPSMMLTPIIEAAFKLALWVSLLMGLTYLLGTASMVPQLTLQNGGQITAVQSKLVFSHEQYAMFFFYVVGTVWFIEISRSLSSFVISYAVILWYYTEKPKNYGPSFPLMRGLIIGLCFHLGTIAFGALIIGLFRPFRIVFLFLSRHAKEGGNPILSLLAGCFTTCIGCAQRYLEFLTKNAYIDTVLSSKEFITSAQNAHGFLLAENGKVTELTGALWVISFSVVSGIFVVTVIMLWTLLTLQESQLSAHHMEVENPYFVIVLSGALSASLSASFMMVFEHTSDTLLYIYLWNKSHGHNTVAKYCPDILANLMGYEKTYQKSMNRPEQAGIFSTFGSFFQDDKAKSKVKPDEEVPLVPR